MSNFKTKKFGKSVLSLLLVVCLVFSCVPFSASAADPIGTTVPKTGTPYPIGNQENNEVNYPAADQQGYVSLQKSAIWSTDGVNYDNTKKDAYVSIRVAGTPYGGTAGTDIVLICDISGSMSRRDMNCFIGPKEDDYRRIDLLKDSVNTFIDIMADKNSRGAENNRISIVPFGSSPAYDRSQKLTNLTDAGVADLKAYVDDMRYRYDDDNGLVSEGTNYNQAFQAANDVITKDIRYRENRERVFIFMSDGEPNGSYNGIADSTVSKGATINATVYSLGMGGDVKDTTLKPLATEPNAPYVDAADSKDGFIGIYQRIAGELQQAATNATIVDKINVNEYFAYDVNRPLKLVDSAGAVTDIPYANALLSGITVDRGNDIVTWELAAVPSQGITLMIPIKFEGNKEGEFYTNLDGGDKNNRKDQASITYTNYNGDQCRKAVPSPVLTRPNARIDIFYYEVDENGKALDITGNATITDQKSFEQDYHLLKSVTLQQKPGTEVDYDADATFKGDNGKYYKYRPNSYKYGTVMADNSPKKITVAIANEEHQIFFAAVEMDSMGFEFNPNNKVYLPSGPLNGEVSTFTFTNVEDATDTMEWKSNETKVLNFGPEVVYKVTETPAYGYQAIADFYIKLDAIQGKLVSVDQNGNAVNAPAGVEITEDGIVFTNNADKTVTRKETYDVNYFTTDGTGTVIEQVTEDVWVHATEIPVDAGKIDLTGKKFPGYTCDLTANTLQKTIPVGDVLQVPHSKNDNDKDNITYYVVYEKDGKEVDRDTNRREVWVGDKGIYTLTQADKDAIKTDKYPGYKATVTIPNTVVDGDIIRVVYEPNYDDKGPFNYTVEYYINNVKKDADTQIETVQAWILATDYTLTAADKAKINVTNKYPGYISATVVPEKVKRDEIIKVYYTTNKDDVKDVSYNIQYVKDGVNDGNPIPVHTQIWVNDTEIPVDMTQINLNKYPGYIIDPANKIPAKVQDGETIYVKYIKSEEKRPLSYKVQYTKDGVNADIDTFTVPTWIGTTKVTVDKKTINLKNKYPGYICNMTEAEIPGEVDDGTTITVAYVKNLNDTKSINYTVEFYYMSDGAMTPFETKDFEIKDVWVGDASAPRIAGDIDTVKPVGYAIVKTDPATLPAEVKEGQVIKVYLGEDQSIKVEITYTIRYEYADGTTKDVPKTEKVWAGDPRASVKATDFELVPNQILSGVTLNGQPVKIFPIRVADQGLIVAKYKVDPASLRDITITVEEYKDGVKTGSKQITIPNVPKGQKYTVDGTEDFIDANKYPGYTLTTAFPQDVDNGDTLKLDYERPSGDGHYTEKYVDKDGNPIEDEDGNTSNEVTVPDIKEGDKIPVQPPKDIPGYLPGRPTPSDKVEEGGTVTVVYDPDYTQVKTVTIDVIYTDVGGAPINAANDGTSGKTLTINDVWVGTKDLYVPRDQLVDKELITVIVGNQTIYYTPLTVQTMVPLDANGYGTASVVYDQAIDINVPISANVKLVGKPLKANYFEFICQPAAGSPGQFGTIYGLNDATGRVRFKMTTPLDNSDIGKVVTFTVSQRLDYAGGTLSETILNGVKVNNPLPTNYRVTYDKNKFTIKMQVVKGANGDAEYQVISYSKAITFNNSAK